MGKVIKTIEVPARPAKKAVPARTKKVEKTVCDFCNATVPKHGSYGWYPNCSICGRDTCEKHNQPDPSEPGDYPEWYCSICIELYLPLRREMEERHWKEEEELKAKVKKQSLDPKLGGSV